MRCPPDPPRILRPSSRPALSRSGGGSQDAGFFLHRPNPRRCPGLSSSGPSGRTGYTSNFCKPFLLDYNRSSTCGNSSPDIRRGTLARWLQAALHDGCKPLGRVLPPVVVGANDYSPLREGYMIEVLCHSQSLRCVTHKACVVCEPLGRVSPSRRGGCLPRGGEGVSPEAGKVSPSRREGCLPRGGEGVSPGAGRVSPPRRGCGFLTSNSHFI